MQKSNKSLQKRSYNDIKEAKSGIKVHIEGKSSRKILTGHLKSISNWIGLKLVVKSPDPTTGV